MASSRVAHTLPGSSPRRAPFFLVAEDDPDDRLLLSCALSEAGDVEARLEFVEDGEQLMDCLLRQGRYADRGLPDFLLLDLNLPRKNGIEALAEIRDTPQIRDLPVVVLTSSASPVDRARVEELAAIEFVTKPDEFEQLVAFVRRLIGFFYKTAR